MSENRLLSLIRNKTPEEKLLNIIKNSTFKKPGPAQLESIDKPIKQPAEKPFYQKILSRNVLAVAGAITIFLIVLTKTFIHTPAPNKLDLINEILGSYAFTGAILGENPQIIMEDKRYLKTYYLKEEESLGGIKILNVKKGMVTLVYKGEKLDIQI